MPKLVRERLDFGNNKLSSPMFICTKEETQSQEHPIVQLQGCSRPGPRTANQLENFFVNPSAVDTGTTYSM